MAAINSIYYILRKQHPDKGREIRASGPCSGPASHFGRQAFDSPSDFLYVDRYVLTTTGGDPMLDINITLVIQLINFLVTLVVLNFLLIGPIRNIIKKRRDLATGMLADAEASTSDAAAKLENYEAALAKAREEAALVRETLKNEAMAKESDILESARADAQAFLQSSREETKNAVDETMSAMQQRVPELSRLVVDRMLGKNDRSPAV